MPKTDPLITEAINKDWNRNVYKYIREIKAISKPHIDDAEGVKKACETYMAISEKYEIKPSIAGLALALGASRTTMLKWLNGEVTIKTADIIAEYYSLIEIFDETAMKDNRINPVAGVFNMKNNHGYKDEVEIVHVDDKKPTNQEIAMKYGQRAEIIDAQPSAVIDYTEPKDEVEIVTEQRPNETIIQDQTLDTEGDDDIPF